MNKLAVIKNRLGQFVGPVSRLLSRFSTHWYALPLLILLCMGCCLLVALGMGYKLFGLTISKWCYQFYLCDYSVGFCSRLLIGAVITHFTDAVSESLMNLIINISVYSTLAIECCASGVIMWTAMKRGSLLGVLFPLLFICNPLTVEFNMGMPGLLDVYLLLLFLIWLCFYRTPFIWIITPVFCFIGMAIQYVFLFAVLPPMLLLLLYRFLNDNSRRERIYSAASFILSAVLSGALAVWFVFLSKNHLNLSSDEFYYTMLERFQVDPAKRQALLYSMSGTPIYKDYFDFNIFGDFNGVNYYGSSISYLTFLKNYTTLYFYWEDFFESFRRFLPSFVLLCVIWVMCLKREKGGLKKFFYLCCILQVLVLVPEILFSTDIYRWVTFAFIAQFSVFFSLYYDEKSILNEVVKI